MKNWKNYINSVEKGNSFDSRKGGHSYTMWTTGNDYRVTLTDGRVIWLQSRSYDKTTVKIIPEPEVFNGCASSLNIPELKFLFSYLFPQGTEEDKIMFLNEEEEALRLIDERHWAEEHRVYSLEITMRLMELVGRWDRVISSRSVSRMRGTGYRNIFYRLQCGEKQYEVEVRANCYSQGKFYDCIYAVKEIDLASEKAERRAFYFKVKELADAAQVPWNIAKLVSDRGGKEIAIEALIAAREIAESDLDEATKHELECGIDRRKAAMVNLLGEHFYMFEVQGQKRSQELASYLLNRGW